ncbi:F protein [Adoxophyes orana nucleopolyhedrovirus]|uniref:F protein n=1 Tax=Adoxophyes orana nucleopolyhedrovirus TaxID=542343 RepID=UPI0001829C41|nr:F protein [Adoxophyes orana nucleopolyhedrovirus]ACF05406.1 F protein [Adoxophyes orana nucleopolyhedrovirus]
MKLYAFFCAIVVVNCNEIIKVGDIITVEKMANTSGFYYQPVGKMQHIENIWTFVIEMNHGQIFEELNELHIDAVKLLKEVNDTTKLTTCVKTKRLMVTSIQSFLFKRIKDLVEKHNVLDSKIKKAGHFESHDKLDIKVRNKRGLLNFVGSVDKFLFGVMDSTDAEELHETARTTNALDEQVKILTDELIKLSSYENHKRCLEESRDDLCTYVPAKFELILEQLNQIGFLYNNLELAVNDAKKNVLNSLVLTPAKLLDAMKLIHLKPEVSWPVSLDMDSMHQLVDNLVTTHVFITKSRTIVFFIEVPLVNNKVYDVFQVVPIPMCRAIRNGEHKCAIVLPDNKFLGLSKDRRNYVRLDDAPMCKNFDDEERMFCLKPQAVHESNQAMQCDIKILLNNEVVDIEKNCDVRIGKFYSEIFYPISDYNNWLYVLENDTELLFDCADSYVLKAGTGIIRGDGTKNCNMNTKKVSLSLRQLKNNLMHSTTLMAPISSQFNLSAAIDDIDKFNVNVVNANSNLDHKNLKDMTERLIDLRARMNNNTIIKIDDSAVNTKDDTTEGWLCWFAGWFNIKCTTVETVLIFLLLFFSFLLIFRIYNCFCAGSFSRMYQCCSSDRPSVVRVNNRLHYMENKAPQTFMMKLLNKKEKTYTDEDVDEDFEDNIKSNFYTKSRN